MASTFSKPHSANTCFASDRIVFQWTRPERTGWVLRKTFSATVSCGTTMECWNTVEIFSRQACTSPRSGAGWPSKRTSPLSAP